MAEVCGPAAWPERGSQANPAGAPKPSCACRCGLWVYFWQGEQLCAVTPHRGQVTGQGCPCACLQLDRYSTQCPHALPSLTCSYEEDLGAALAILADQGAKFDKARARVALWLWGGWQQLGGARLRCQDGSAMPDQLCHAPPCTPHT